MMSLCRVIAPSGNMISGRLPSTRMSIAVSIAWRSFPSRNTLKAPMPADHERLEPALLEQVPTGHGEQMAIRFQASMPSTIGSDSRQWFGASMMLLPAASDAWSRSTWRLSTEWTP